jgi:uncharacterized protein YndB with AHSA1/START domain
MTEGPLTHSTFSLDRDYAVPPEKVFRAFSDPETKARWFGGPESVWRRVSADMDFREGGHEHSEGVLANGATTTRFDATYHEIVEDRRIVYDYEMRINGERISVSLATIELSPTAIGTHLVITEQGVYFDEQDGMHERENGTRQLLESIAQLFEG